MKVMKDITLAPGRKPYYFGCKAETVNGLAPNERWDIGDIKTNMPHGVT